MEPLFHIDHPGASYSGDEWDEFVGAANRLRVRSVDNVRLRVTYREAGLLSDLRPTLERLKEQTLGNLDPRIISADPPLLMSQEQHDERYLEGWRHAEKLLDRIFQDHYFPLVRRRPLERSRDGMANVQISALIDFPAGCRQLSYAMQRSGQFDRTTLVLPTLTLDTSVVFELWKRGRKVNAVERLIQLGRTPSMSLRVTGRIFEDVPRPPLADEIARLLDVGIDTMSSVIRPQHWRVGVDTPGTRAFAQAYFDLTDPQNQEGRRDWKDWDHLHAHFVNKRDVFLTWDNKLLRYGEGLRERLGLVVMRPEDYLAQVSTEDPSGMQLRGTRPRFNREVEQCAS